VYRCTSHALGDAERAALRPLLLDTASNPMAREHRAMRALARCWPTRHPSIGEALPGEPSS